MTQNKPSFHMCVLCQENIVIMRKEPFGRGEIICDKCIAKLKKQVVQENIEKEKGKWKQ